MKRKFRVMVDTNTLISGIVFKGVEHRLLEKARENKFKLVLSEDVIEETKEVIKRKLPDKIAMVDEFLENIKFEYLPVKQYQKLIPKYKNFMSDSEDIPILVSGIKANPDYFVTGDKHFKTQRVKKLLNIVTSRQILEKFEDTLTFDIDKKSKEHKLDLKLDS